MGAAEKMVLWDSWLRGGVAESDWANVLASRHRYLLPTNPGCCVDRLSWHHLMDVAAHKHIAVTVARRHRVVVEPIAHQRQRGDSRGHLLAGVVRRRQRRLKGGKVALQPLADRPVMAA